MIIKISDDFKFNPKDKDGVRRLYDLIKYIIVRKTININGKIAIAEIQNIKDISVMRIDGVFSDNFSYSYYEIDPFYNIKEVDLDAYFKE